MTWADLAYFFLRVAVLLALWGALNALRAAVREREGRRDLAVLRHVAEQGETYAVPLIEAGLGSAGSVHLRLRRLVFEGFLCVREVPGGPDLDHRPRFLYSLTAGGMARLAALDLLGPAGGVS